MSLMPSWVHKGIGYGVYGYTNGTGHAGVFEIDNASNSSSALMGNKRKWYWGVWLHERYRPCWNVFTCDDFWNTSDCLVGIHNGNGTAVAGLANGGYGVYGYSSWIRWVF